MAVSVATSCKDKSPIAQAISQYKAGEISDDSLLQVLSDSSNLKSALEWAQKNLSHDDYAAFILGRAYKFGLGVERNPNKAKAYYIMSANQDNTNAMMGLAELYAGYPGHEDIDSAFYWFKKAGEKGDGSAYFYLGQLEGMRQAKENHLIDTTAIIKYWEKGAKLNDPSCISAMATSYYTGQGVPVDKNKAFNMLSLVDESKLDPNGLYLLGVMYELGEGTPQNFNAALHYDRLAATKGNTDAICKLGNFYQYGQGVEQNDSIAFVNYQKAANAGNAWAQRCVAACYNAGVGTERNIDKARTWFEIAAKNGDFEAQKFCSEHRIEY